MNTAFTRTALAAALFALAGTAGAQTVVKLGQVSPMTGNIAHFGKDNEWGAKLAIEDLNAKKLKIGGQEVTFELLSEDDGADPKQATAAAQKLADAKVRGVIGHLNSGTSIPASKIYSDNNIPQISPASTNPKYTQQGFKTTFRVVANDGQLGGTLGRYAVNDLKLTKVAVIDDRSAYGQGVADEFAKAAKAAGATIVGREYTNDKATDFSAVLTSIKGKRPDLVFFGGMDSVAGPMLRQMKQLGIKARFMGGDGICTDELGKLAGDALADGQVVCAEAGGVTKDKEAGMQAWRARFKERAGQEVVLYSPYVYDAMMVMVSAMQKADSTDPAKYLPELAKTNYDGVTGKIAFDAKGDMKEASLTIYTYKGGKRDLVMVTK